jgi:hypothetical protein
MRAACAGRFAVLTGALVLMPMAAGAQPAAASAPAGPSRFDGAWLARIDCPSNTEDSSARGYKFDFPITVVDGRLSGGRGEDGPGSLHVSGEIPPDGDAVLRARGRTGEPEFAVRQPTSGTAYTYRIKAHFDEKSGTGSRLEARVCNFRFTRR